jgi:transposase-like protein
MKHRSGENHERWKGNEVGYDGIHIWVTKHKGKPSHCEYCGKTDRKKYEWANVDNQYRRVLEDYIRLCTSCHRKYDYRFYKPNFDVEEAKRLQAEGLSFRAIARKLGVRTHGTIQRYLTK